AAIGVGGAGVAVLVALLLSALEPIVVVRVGHAGPPLATVARVRAGASLRYAVVVGETVAARDLQRVVFTGPLLPVRIGGVGVGGAAVRRQLARFTAQPSHELTHVALGRAALRLAATKNVARVFALAECVALARTGQIGFGVAGAGIGVSRGRRAGGPAAARRLADAHARRAGAARPAAAVCAVGGAEHAGLSGLAALWTHLERGAVAELVGVVALDAV